MIEAVDSLKLLKEINKQAAKHDRVVKVSVWNLHIASEEETKYGAWHLMLAVNSLEEGEWSTMEHVQICGTDDDGI